MPLPTPTRLLAGFLLAFTLAGCGLGRDKVAPPASPPQAVSAAPSQKPPAVWPQNHLQQTALENQARQLLLDGKYAEIEKQAAQLRRSGEQFVDGKNKLLVFYHGLSDVPEQGTEADWQKLEKRLLAWRKQQLKSMTARVAVAMTYYHGGMLARGRRFAYKVTDKQWGLMAKRIAQAFKEVKATQWAMDKCPGWHLASQDVAFASSVNKETYDLVTDKALERFPNVTNFHLGQVHYRMDRWNGEPGDWQAYAARVADSKPGEAGDIFYARAVWYLIDILNDLKAAELKTFDWPRAQRGFEALMKTGDPYSVSGPYAVAAWLQRDRPTLKRLFDQHIGNQGDPTVWKRVETLVEARQWAETGKDE